MALDEENGVSRREREETSKLEPETSKGFGITIENLTSENVRRYRIPDAVRGALVTDVDAGSPAAEDGLRPGDVLVKVDGVIVASAVEAQRELTRVPSGGTAKLIISRTTRAGTQQIFLTVTKQ